MYNVFFYDNLQCFIGKTKSKEDNLPYKHPTSQGADYQAKTQKPDVYNVVHTDMDVTHNTFV